jgi:phospholipid transport system transporter-binding protein
MAVTTVKDSAATFDFKTLGEGRFQLSGVLGFPTATQVLERSKALFEQRAIEVDLQGVTHADSAGLAVLLEWLHWARREGRRMTFINVPEEIRAVARITEVEELLEQPPRVLR